MDAASVEQPMDGIAKPAEPEHFEPEEGQPMNVGLAGPVQIVENHLEGHQQSDLLPATKGINPPMSLRPALSSPRYPEEACSPPRELVSTA